MSADQQNNTIESPKVSVIIPVYNTEKYLNECLDSVILQDLKDIEILCVDDGSTDSSRKILDEYASLDNRVVVIHKKNEGVSKARNIGIKWARGKYVIFMDPDDYYPTADILSTLFVAAEEHKVSIVGSEFSHLTPEGIVEYGDIYNNDFLYGYNFDKEGLIHFKDYQFDYGFHRFLFLKDYLICNDIDFPDLSRFQDPPFLVNALSNAGFFYAVKKIGYRYRLKSEGVSWNTQKITDLVSGILYIHDIANKNGYDKLERLMQLRMTVEYGGYIRQALEDCLKVDQEYKKVKKSFSYQTGLIVTYVPRNVIHLVHDLFKKA